MRYTISHLYSDMKRYHVHRLYIDGVFGRREVPREMLDQLVRDGLSSDQLSSNPHTTSPWLLEAHARVGVLRPNPGGKRNRDGTRGGVRFAGLRAGITRGGRAKSGLTRARRMYQGRTPVSDAPLIERIQSRRSRQAARRRLDVTD
jgi:hypothetical protein